MATSQNAARTTQARNMTQITLGEFINLLNDVPPYQQVVMDFGDVPMGETQLFDCYVGYPDELAIRYRPPMNDDRMTSAQSIIRRAHEAVSCTFIDHMGQKRTMSPQTPLWAANWRHTTHNAIVGVEEKKNTVIIRTWMIE